MSAEPWWVPSSHRLASEGDPVHGRQQLARVVAAAAARWLPLSWV
jgi:hypothetical protein